MQAPVVELQAYAEILAFFINGVRHNGGYDPESLLAALGAVPAPVF